MGSFCYNFKLLLALSTFEDLTPPVATFQSTFPSQSTFLFVYTDYIGLTSALISGLSVKIRFTIFVASGTVG